MKRYFITGLVILLPVALTIAIVSFIFNLLTVPFLGIIKAIFGEHDLFTQGFLFLNAEQMQNLVVQLLILGSLFVLALGLGFIARWFFFRTFLKCADYVVKRIPLVRTIYKTCQDVIRTLFTSDTNSFKQVVMVRFPNQDSFALGLITREEMPALAETSHADAIGVFIPTTPNPTSGFLIMYRPQDLLYLDMKIEDAFKYIISCGVISPTFNVISKEEALQAHREVLHDEIL